MSAEQKPVALDLIRARDLCGMGTPATQAAADRRELLRMLDSLTETNARLQQDAARYRWLRDADRTIAIRTGPHDSYRERWYYKGEGESLDAAIDGALASDYDALNDKLQASQCAESMLESDVKALKAKLRVAAETLKRYSAHSRVGLEASQALEQIGPIPEL